MDNTTYIIILFTVLLISIIIILLFVLTHFDTYFVKYMIYIYIINILYKYITCNTKKIMIIYNRKCFYNKYILIRRKNAIYHTCNICYNEINEENLDYNNVISFSCCKFNNKICCNCLIRYITIQCRGKKKDIYTKFDCPFCKQSIYMLQLHPKISYKVLNKIIQSV